MRTEKVASIQAALAAGTYNVPASAVASKLVDACWAGSRRSEGFMGEFRGHPKSVETSVGLKALIVEASRALARLDAGRLEELAFSCQALDRTMARGNADFDARRQMAQHAQEAATDMAVFARVLDATRANLHVMNRLQELRMGRLECSERQVRGGMGAEAGHGDH